MGSSGQMNPVVWDPGERGVAFNINTVLLVETDLSTLVHTVVIALLLMSVHFWAFYITKHKSSIPYQIVIST